MRVKKSTQAGFNTKFRERILSLPFNVEKVIKFQGSESSQIVGLHAVVAKT